MLHGRKGRKERLIPSSQDATETSKAKQKIGHIPAFRRATATTTFKPLIFVPGLLASTLARRINNTVTDEEGWEYFWPPPYNLSPQDSEKRMLQGLQSDIRSSPTDKTPVKAMGLYPWDYDYLVNAIMLWGYTLNVNFWIFPYDWRQSNRISGKLLADFIHENVGESTSGVDIINHSMGGFVTRAAALMYKAPIDRVVYIASPHYGCPLSYFSLNPDIPYDQFELFVNIPPVDNTLNTLAKLASLPTSRLNIDDPTARAAINFNDQLEEVFRKFPSMYELLPDPFYLETVPMLYSDNRAVLGAEQTYLEGDWKLTEDPATISKVKDAMKFKKEELGKDLPKASNSLIIYGVDERTADTVEYQTRFFVSENRPGITHDANHVFGRPYDSGQKGDGWVPKLSAMGTMSGIESENSKSFKDTHVTIPNNYSVIKAALEFLSGNS